MSTIVLDGVSKTFPDGTQAVRSLDLEIGDGELLVLVGPSGCGKTTALRMVAGLEDVTSGSIIIDGRRVNDVEPRHRDVAMVFQSYALYPHLTVYDNMAFSLKYRGVPKPVIMARVAEAARILELEPYLRRKPRELSGGQRQRVAMGRAIVRQPRAFLMDEPLSNLDAKLRVQMRAEIAQLQRSLGTTTIYVTHDQTEAMTLGTKVAVLSAGALQQVAQPQELYRRPANLFVAGFIGSPPMNLIDARLERADEAGGAGEGAGGAGGAGEAGETGETGAGAGGPDVVFGPHRLRVPPQVLREHPGLDGYLGRPVVLGIRPEHIHDAALWIGGEPPGVPPGQRDAGARCVIEVPIRLREELGSEVQVHGAIGGAVHLDSADDVRSLATIMARLDSRSAIAEGQTAALTVDTAELHFFDPESGGSIRRLGGDSAARDSAARDSAARPAHRTADEHRRRGNILIFQIIVAIDRRDGKVPMTR